MILDLVRRVPSHVLARLRRSAVARAIARRVLLPFFPAIVTIPRGAAKGLRFLREGALVSYLLGTDEPGVQAVCERLVAPGTIAWDVGANVGFFTVVLARLVGPGGRVVAVEPRTAAAALVQANAGLNGMDNVQVVARAASSITGAATFHLREKPTASSLSEGAPDVGTIEVAAVRLDDLVEVEQFPAPDFVKMDIEGGEVEALAGMRGLLETARPILVIENHGYPSEVAAELRRARYAVRVMGGGEDLPHAPWNAIAIGVPEERPDLLGRIADVVERR